MSANKGAPNEPTVFSINRMPGKSGEAANKRLEIST